MPTRLTADIHSKIFVVEDRDTKQELCIVVNTGCRLKELSGGIVNLEFPRTEADMARIIIADDDTIIVELIRAALESGGHVVGALPDGENVGRVTDLKRPDLVILDSSMPVKSGIDALRDIRLSPISYGTPVLMLTGSLHRANEEIAMRAGANEYLRKPFDRDQLLGSGPIKMLA